MDKSLPGPRAPAHQASATRRRAVCKAQPAAALVKAVFTAPTHGCCARVPCVRVAAAVAFIKQPLSARGGPGGRPTRPACRRSPRRLPPRLTRSAPRRPRRLLADRPPPSTVSCASESGDSVRARRGPGGARPSPAGSPAGPGYEAWAASESPARSGKAPASQPASAVQAITGPPRAGQPRPGPGRPAPALAGPNQAGPGPGSRRAVPASESPHRAARRRTAGSRSAAAAAAAAAAARGRGGSLLASSLDCQQGDSDVSGSDEWPGPGE